MPELTPEQKLSITRHLAEKVMGCEVFKGRLGRRGYGDCEQIRFPDGRIRVFAGTYPMELVWDPFGDANAALEVLLKSPGAATATLDRRLVQDGEESIVSEWAVWLELDEPGRIAEGYSFDLLLAICLACAKATGWKG